MNATKMFTKILLVAGILVSGATFAADNGIYIGASLGQARPSFDSPNSAIAAGAAVTFDNSAYAYKVYGGYQLNQYFGVELIYHNLGEYNILIGGKLNKADITGWGGALVGAAPIGKDVSLLGRIGMTHTRETFAGSSDNIWSPSFGVGLKYDFNPNLSARGEFERFTKIGSNDNTIGAHANVWTLGLGYKF
jgi:OmpA-OmpF porin, OOP family